MTYTTRIDQFENLRLEFIEDGFKKSVVEHEFPGVDGAVLEDMGAAAERFRFVVWFFKRTVAQFSAFYDHIKQNRVVTFVHPERGPIRGRIVQTARRIVDAKQAIAVEITLVEDRVTDSVPMPSTDVSRQIAEEFAAAQEAQMRDAEALVRTAVGPDAADVLAAAVPSSGSVMTAYPTVTGVTRSWLITLDKAVGKIDAFMSDNAVPSGSITADIDYGTGLPGRMVRSLAECGERIAASLDTQRRSPYRWIDNFCQGFERLKTSAGSLLSQLLATRSALGMVHLSTLLGEDEARRDPAKAAEATESFDMTGRFFGTASYPEYASVNEIENALYAMNVATQEAVTQIRSEYGTLDNIKAMARYLTEYVNDIKIERELLMSVDIEPWLPLHVICVQRGYPYKFAERLMRINHRIVNPTFASGTLSLYAK